MVDNSDATLMIKVRTNIVEVRNTFQELLAQADALEEADYDNLSGTLFLLEMYARRAAAAAYQIHKNRLALKFDAVFVVDRIGKVCSLEQG